MVKFGHLVFRSLADASDVFLKANVAELSAIHSRVKTLVDKDLMYWGARFSESAANIYPILPAAQEFLRAEEVVAASTRGAERVIRELTVIAEFNPEKAASVSDGMGPLCLALLELYESATTSLFARGADKAGQCIESTQACYRRLQDYLDRLERDVLKALVNDPSSQPLYHVLQKIGDVAEGLLDASDIAAVLASSDYSYD